MTTPDRPLFTAQVVDSGEPNIVVIDLAKHEVIKKTPLEMVKMIGRERFRAKLGYRVGTFSMLGGLGVLSLSVFNLITGGQPLSSFSSFSASGALLGVAALLYIRSEGLEQKVETLEHALNADIRG